MKIFMRILGIAFLMLLLNGSCQQKDKNAVLAEDQPIIKKEIIIDAGNRFQTIDGFGVNINPAQWRNGELKTAIDMLVDDLGCTLFRFDCYGLANWLDPEKQNSDKTFTDSYLEKVYTSKIFTDSWACFRYLNTKGIEPVFNISGIVPPAWSEDQRLTDFESYAGMAVSLLKWAREKEKLEFSLFMPFNETDLGYPEGPKMEPSDCLPASKTLLAKMKKAGLEDIKLILMGDSQPVIGKVRAFLEDPSLVNDIYAFSMHTYGNGLDADNRTPWPYGPSPFENMLNSIDKSPYKGKPIWLTEYGDLDQTNEIEFEFAWRSARRLLRILNDGVTAGLAWDAFDNFHKHDAAWTTFGLLETDTNSWDYTPRKRYYAAKQIYKFVRPGFQRIQHEALGINPDDPYARLRHPLRNVDLSVYASPDNKDITIIGMSLVEEDVAMIFDLKGFSGDISGKTVKYYRTGKSENCVMVNELPIIDNSFSATIKERSIFTLTTHL